jgi:hypothetical protein
MFIYDWLCYIEFTTLITPQRRSQWPRGLRRGSVAARLLRLCVRIPPGVRMSVCFVCCQVEVSATSWSLVQRSLPTVVRRCVWYRNLVNEEALAHWRQSRQKQTKNYSPALQNKDLFKGTILCVYCMQAPSKSMINQNNRYPDKESYPHTLITQQKYLTTIIYSKDTTVGNYIMGTPTKSWFGTHVSYRMAAIHLTSLCTNSYRWNHVLRTADDDEISQ